MANDDGMRERPRSGWQPELEELQLRQRLAREMGGTDKVARQHAGGRLTIRERIERLADPGTFREIGEIAGRGAYDATGRLTGFTPANRITGRAMLDGRPVVISGDDFTVRGGSADATIPGKTTISERMAAELRIPIIRIVEGSGGGGSVKTIETKGAANLPGGIGGTRWYATTTGNMARVPVVGLGLGSVADLGAARLAHAEASLGEALHESGRQLLALWFDWLAEAGQSDVWRTQVELAERQLDAVNARIRLGEAARAELDALTAAGAASA